MTSSKAALTRKHTSAPGVLGRWAWPLVLSAAYACGAEVTGPTRGHYRDDDPDSGNQPYGELPPDLQKGMVAGPPIVRGLSNREYLRAASDLIGVPLAASLIASWSPTTQFSGFDSVPWTNLDTKAVRDRLDTVESILDQAVVSAKVMTCSVAGDAELAYAGCARSILEPFAARAFGRPLRPEEAASLANAYERGSALARTRPSDADGIFKEGVRVALGSVLLAPQFITRIELPTSAEAGGERALDAYEVANRLSFTLFGSIPDDELWAKAQDGTLLSDPMQLGVQVNRLLDSRTEAFVESFMGQWFDFRAYEYSAADTLERALFEETQKTLTDVVKHDLPVTALLAPGFTYVNQRIAAHYGLGGSFGPGLEKLATEQRGGILQQGSWLTLSASPQGTKPIHRGRLLQDRLLCKAVPPPDSALFEQIQAASAAIPATATVKERLEAHRNAGPACFACHQYMDPIGLGLEGFDQQGKERSFYADTGYPVETDSNILGRPFSTARELNAILASMPEYRRCAAEKVAIYSLKRAIHGQEGPDKALLDALAFEVEGGRAPSFRQIVLRLVQSKSFLTIDHGTRN